MKGLVAGAIAIAILALLIPGADKPKQPKTARAAAISTSGSLSLASTRAGMPIFTASNVDAGALVEGAVTIANTGRATGYFSLSQADLTDVPGPNGGPLTEKLRLEVDDVTNPSKPVDVYTGRFDGMGIRPLGFIAPDSERDYRFTALISDTGGPGSPIGGDSAYRGSAASARFVWSAVQGGPLEGPGRRTPPIRDRQPPRLRVSIPKLQPLLTRSYVTTRARCDEACTLTVQGRSGAGRPRPVRRKLRAGRTASVPVRLPRPALRAVRRQLLDGKPVVVRLTFTALDRERNRSLVKRKLRLRPRPR